MFGERTPPRALRDAAICRKLVCYGSTRPVLMYMAVTQLLSSQFPALKSDEPSPFDYSIVN